MESWGVPLGPYRATKLESGMPLRKHRQHFKKYGKIIAILLIDLLRNNSNFGPKVTRQHTIQLLRKFLKNHVIEDIKGRWGSENVDDNNQLFRFPATSPFKTLTPKKHGLHLSQENSEKIKHEIINEDQENAVDNRELSQEDVEEIWRYVILIYLQTILGVPSLEEVINPEQVIPQYIMYNMASTSKHGVVILQNKSDDLPHWVLSAMKCLANWPRSDVVNNPTYVGFEQGIFSTITDYFLDLLEPLLTFEYYELFVNILVVCERVAIDVLQLCRLLLPPPNCRKLQLLMRMISQISQNVDMPKLHDAMGVRSLMIHTFSQCVLCCAEEVDLDKLLAGRLVSFLMDHHQEILQVLTYLQTAGHTENPGDGLFVPLPTYSYCKQISAQGFEKHKVYTSQAAITELLENVIKNKLTSKEKRKKLKQFQKEYPLIYQKRFPTTESEAALFGDKPTIKQPMLILRKPKFCSLRY
uniref:Rho-GAP domain-containing protein n=1 Tax=Nomascus leucogenys TaxID=61853 RepID=A0A2I3FUF0_NOMLE